MLNTGPFDGKKKYCRQLAWKWNEMKWKHCKRITHTLTGPPVGRTDRFMLQFEFKYAWHWAWERVVGFLRANWPHGLWRAKHKHISTCWIAGGSGSFLFFVVSFRLCPTVWLLCVKWTRLCERKNAIWVRPCRIRDRLAHKGYITACMGCGADGGGGGGDWKG